MWESLVRKKRGGGGGENRGEGERLRVWAWIITGEGYIVKDYDRSFGTRTYGFCHARKYVGTPFLLPLWTFSLAFGLLF